MQVSGYLPDYRLAGFQAERGRLLTDLVCFSIQLAANGQLDAAAAAIKVSGFKKLAQTSSQPVHLCIGGWERSAGFLQASATTASRLRLGQQLARFCRAHGFSGVDLDWEHPKGPVQQAAYTRLIVETKKAFTPLQLSVTAAIAGWQQLSPAAGKSLDRIHLMSYDADGRHSTFQQAQKDIDRLRRSGIPADRICLGLPFYGRSLDKKRTAHTYAEIVRRFAPFVGTGYEKGVTLSNKPVEVYALYGGQWPHSSFMVPGGVMCAPTLADVTRSIAILDFWKDNWLEEEWLGCSVERWMELKTWEDVQEWMEENESQKNSDCALFIRYALSIGLDKIGRGVGDFIATGTYMQPELYEHPTIEGRNAALQSRSGIFADGEYHDFDQANVAEDHTFSFFEGSGQLHPFDGKTEPIDPKVGKAQNKYTWAKAPRYNVPGKGYRPLEAGPLARQIIAGRDGAADHQDYDPLVRDLVDQMGPSVFTRVFARMHEAPKLFAKVKQWISEIDLHESFYTKPVEHADGERFRAPRHAFAERALGRKRHHLVRREATLGQDVQHFTAHVARGADDSNSVAHGISPLSGRGPLPYRGGT